MVFVLGDANVEGITKLLNQFSGKGAEENRKNAELLARAGVSRAV